MFPAKIGRYEIKEELGRGGLGPVYRGFDRSSNRDVAIKVVPREMLRNPESRMRFTRDLKALTQLEHPAIVPLYEVGEEEGQPFFVMRYMPGGPLTYLIGAGRISLEETARIIEKLAQALAYAHKKGIVHGDLRPDNILFDREDNPFISDFSVANLMGSAVSTAGSGTPAYMSPEQIEGKKIDARSDVYSLGVIVYEMLTGRKPYSSDDPKNILARHISGPLPEILKVNPDLPVEVDAIIKKAMAKDRSKRFSSPLELAAALKLAAFGKAGGVTGITHPALAMRKPSRRWTGTAFFVILAVLLTLAVGFILMNRLLTAAPAQSISTQPLIVSAASPTQPNPTATVELTPAQTIPATLIPTDVPIPGGADKIALFSANDIWMMNMNGSEAYPITNDRSSKSNLQWLSDGKRLVFISDQCAYLVEAGTGQSQKITCLTSAEFFEGFRVSPDGSRVAISLNRELIIVPFDLERLKKAENKRDLLELEGSCVYNKVSARDARWSADGKRIAFVYGDASGARFMDGIRVLDVSRCATVQPTLLDEFPAGIALEEYASDPFISSFDWNGENLFLFTNSIRNGGYGNLYLYDMGSRQGRIVNPFEGACCYRDARFSPDGKYVLLLFQDARLAEDSETRLYYVTYEALLSGDLGEAIRVPISLFANPREKPQPALRPAQ